MTIQSCAKITGAVVGALAIALAAISMKAPRVQANDDDTESRAQIGLRIAPVPLNLQGKNRALVGLGSYLVNAVADCNGCHSAGPPTEFAPGGNPYLNQPTKINPATYLGGGRDFGPYPGPGPFPHIISRNLTPDKTGLPEGGHTFDEFLQIIRTGVDMDHLHPTCTGAPDGTCLPPPFDGALLQVMPWPIHRNMSKHDLRAIYEYLSAVPCNAGPPAPSVLHNDCE
jgi:hypothetical protein